jgi:hypothetical protein
VDRPVSSNTTQIPGRQITQETPSPDYTVFYWSALRACLQTGRSEWECKSGEYRFVRDALAIEAELSARDQQRRQEMRTRAQFESPAMARSASPSGGEYNPPRSRSLMLEERPEPELQGIPLVHEWDIAARGATDRAPTR